jgi:predicted metalloprotease with PDZ domain
MKANIKYIYILIGILFFTACTSIDRPTQVKSQNNIELSYVFKPILNTPKPRLQIDLYFKGNSSGKEGIQVPSNWVGKTQLYKNILDLTAESAQTTLQDTMEHELKEVHFTPGSRVHLRYFIEQPQKDLIKNRNYFLPIVQKNLIHFIGNALLVTPKWPTNKRLKVSFNWIDLPKNWQVANSFGAKNTTQIIKADLIHLKGGLFLAGELRIYPTTVKNKPVYVAMSGKYRFTDEIFVDTVQKVFTYQRGFWKDHHFPYYLVSLIPVSKECCFYAGLSLENAFATFLASDKAINFNLVHVLSHEIFHTWNGGIISPQHPYASVAWFTEGFTNYYARLLNLRSGLIDLKDYIKDYNRVLKAYYESPYQKSMNYRVKNEFWTKKSLNKLPYHKGDILAHLWNDRIKVYSKNKKNLDHFMRSYLQAAYAYRASISPHNINLIMQPYLNENIDLEIKKYIDIGEVIVPTANLGSCITLEHVKSSKKASIPQYILNDKKFKENPDSCLDYFR